jgi:DNA-directed RNA polymerase omega subunit
MKKKQLEQFLGRMDSRYRAVIVASKRAKQLQQGLRPLFEGKSAKVTTMALEEFVNEKVDYYITNPEQENVKPAAEAVPEKTKAAKSDSSE